eukprot:4352258-Pyramimonas_sp.AAC.1
MEVGAGVGAGYGYGYIGWDGCGCAPIGPNIPKFRIFATASSRDSGGPGFFASPMRTPQFGENR